MLSANRRGCWLLNWLGTNAQNVPFFPYCLKANNLYENSLHLRKIDLVDEIFVIDVGGYIGESTR